MFIFCVLYFFVIGLVGLCCNPQPLVIIIIIIIPGAAGVYELLRIVVVYLHKC